MMKKKKKKLPKQIAKKERKEKAAKEEKKKFHGKTENMGRPRAGGLKRVSRSFYLTVDDLDFLVQFGQGRHSTGLTKAVRVLREALESTIKKGEAVVLEKFEKPGKVFNKKIVTALLHPKNEDNLD